MYRTSDEKYRLFDIELGQNKMLDEDFAVQVETGPCSVLYSISLTDSNTARQ
jgi:hypothetical protein